MRVLYLTMNPNRESTTVPTEGWFGCLRSQGLEPVLVASRCGPFTEWARGEQIPTYHVPLPFPDKRHPWPFLTSMRNVARIAWKHGVDLVHSNEQDVYPISQYVARLLRVPVVVSVHFTMEPGFSRWAFGGRRQPARMFFLSRGSREASRAGVTGVVPEERWRLLYNGLNMERFRPNDALRLAFRREHGLSDADFVIGTACALRPRKQLEHLFAAADALRDPRVRVVVAGKPVDGDEDYAVRLLAEARRQLGDRFLYLGHLGDLRPFYNGLDLFVNSSKEEACSISIVESLACGRPVVGYPSTSVDEQVLPGGGEIVPQDDISALVACLRRWVQPGQVPDNARVKARERAVVFDIRALSRQLWAEYQELADVSSRKEAERQ